MEIPELNIISDFAAGMNCLQNPSLFSQIFSISGTGKVPKLYSFWKWGAVILALVATFSGIITRIKLLIVRFCKEKLLSSSGPSIQQLHDEYDDDEDDPCLSDSTENEDYEPTTPFDDRPPVDDDSCVAGSSFYCDDRHRQDRDMGLRRRRSAGDRFSWSDICIGKSVVKLWDSLGLGLDFCEDSPGNVVSIWDLNKDRKISSFSGYGSQIPAVSMSSSAIILSAGSNNNGHVLLGVHDLRDGRQIPALYSEWQPRRGMVVGINSGGVEKVYVIDDVTGPLTIGDLRNVKAPLENLTETYGDC